MAPRLTELTSRLSALTAQLDSYLRDHNYPEPSFEVDGPVSIIPNHNKAMEEVRQDAIEVSLEIHQLLRNPKDLLIPQPNNFSNIHAVHKFGIATKLELHEEITYQELAARCNLPTSKVRQVIRYVIAHQRIFREPRKGIVAHSAASRALAEDQAASNKVGLFFDQAWHSFHHQCTALEQFPNSEEPADSGFGLAYGGRSLYQVYEDRPELAKRFAELMSSQSSSLMDFLATAPVWAKVGPCGVVVDVGGSEGQASAYLARALPSLKFISQDLPAAMTKTNAVFVLPSALQGRVTLMAHDFFQQQPIVNADVYLFRYIFHNWGDKSCVRILQQLVPALKKGAKIVVQDTILPEPESLTPLDEKMLRTLDCEMLAIHNARERDEEDWLELFELADQRFRFVHVAKDQRGYSGLLVFEWDP